MAEHNPFMSRIRELLYFLSTSPLNVPPKPPSVLSGTPGPSGSFQMYTLCPECEWAVKSLSPGRREAGTQAVCIWESKGLIMLSQEKQLANRNYWGPLSTEPGI